MAAAAAAEDDEEESLRDTGRGPHAAAGSCSQNRTRLASRVTVTGKRVQTVKEGHGEEMAGGIVGDEDTGSAAAWDQSRSHAAKEEAGGLSATGMGYRQQ